jgi:hypothetical protein
MQILRNFQTNLVRNQKLSKTQNNPKKVLKLIQIQIYFILFYFKK